MYKFRHILYNLHAFAYLSVFRIFEYAAFGTHAIIPHVHSQYVPYIPVENAHTFSFVWHSSDDEEHIVHIHTYTHTFHIVISVVMFFLSRLIHRYVVSLDSHKHVFCLINCLHSKCALYQHEATQRVWKFTYTRIYVAQFAIQVFYATLFISLFVLL